MLEFKNVTVKKSGKVLIDNISFSAEKGKITAIIGKNGSGKSTLVGCLSSANKYSGSILIEGKDISKLTLRERARLVAILPQIMPQNDFSIRSLVQLGRNPYVGGMGILSKEDRLAAENALEITNMVQFAERSFSTLSGGEKKRAFIAMLLAQETPIIVLDEPMAHLDPASASEISSLLSHLAKDLGKTLLMVMHELSDAIELSHRIALISGGGLAEFGNSEHFLKNKIIEKYFYLRRFEGTNGEEKRIFFR